MALAIRRDRTPASVRMWARRARNPRAVRTRLPSDRGAAGDAAGADPARPDPERDGVSSWTRADIALLIERRFGHRYHVSSLSKILRALGFSRQKTRPSHPNADPKARVAWLKKGATRCPRPAGKGPSGQADRAVFAG